MKKTIQGLAVLLLILGIYFLYLFFSNPYHAAAKGKFNTVRLHLLLGADINYTPVRFLTGSNRKVTLLHYAAMGGQTQMVQWLLERGADIEAKTFVDNMTPLHYAANEARHKVVALLLKHNSEINALDSNGQTPLMLAIDPEWVTGKGYTRVTLAGDRPSTIEFLLSQGADPHINGQYGKTTMMAAASHRNLEVMKRLLFMQVDINAVTTSPNPRNAFTYLLDSNSQDDQRERMEPIVFQWLLENMIARADVDAENNNLLHKNCYPEVLKVLVREAIDINQKNNQGRTPLHKAFSNWNCKVAALDILIAAGADLKARDNEGKTMLHIAASHFQAEKMKLILDLITDIQVRDNEGNTAIHVFTRGGNMPEMAVLLARGLDINAQNNSGDTVLHRLLDRKHQRCDRAQWLLLEANVNPNIQNNDGQTALHIAAKNPSTAKVCVPVLLASGGRLDIKDRHERYPYDIALASSVGQPYADLFKFEEKSPASGQ